MRAFVVLILLLASINLHATQRAVTEEGVVVILHEDGTWKVESKDGAAPVKIQVNDTAFEKPTTATFNVKSTRNRTTIAFNPEIWSFKKPATTTDAEYKFRLDGKDLYGMLITEQIEIDIEGLTNLVLENAKKVAPDTRAIKKEYRKVNGTKVMYMEMRGTVNGMDVTYRGYYSSNKSGTTQLLAYTGSSLVDRYSSEIDDFLNGLGVQP